MDGSDRRTSTCGVFYRIVMIMAVSLTSCVSRLDRTRWSVPHDAEPDRSELGTLNGPSTVLRAGPGTPIAPDTNLAGANQLGANAEAAAEYARGLELERQFSPACLTHYYRAARRSWPLAAQVTTGDVGPRQPRGWEIYHSSVAKLATLGPKYGRWHPTAGLQLDGEPTIPPAYHGFVWQPADFQTMEAVGEFSRQAVRNDHRTEGLGVPLVVTGQRSPAPAFMRSRHVFAATVVLHPVEPADPERSPWVLSLHDPLRVDHFDLGDRSVDLARDLTAPIVYQIQDTARSNLEGLLRPASTKVAAKLTMLEPYQPGKIPVVFVHGLASDRLTWANMVNDLRAKPDLMGRYQIWTFEYATGRPFLESASRFRQSLLTVRATIDPAGDDAAVDHMVLVGHSLGGLVSKLQVTYSADQIWKSVSFEDRQRVRASADVQARLDRLFFFEPVPSVRRVVFMGTPHQGSSYARRFIGRFTSSLVRLPTDERQAHRQLMEQNPGAFSSVVRRRVPNSVDLLEPESRVLRAIHSLKVSDQVQLHSIIGTGGWITGAGRGDGVVTVASAHHPGTVSELYVDARHQTLQSAPESVEEVARILRWHLATL